MTDPDDPALESTASEPAISVIHGNPTAEEVAALVAVLAMSRSGPAGADASAPKAAGWSAYWRAVRAPLMPGPDAWRASGRGS